MTSVENITRLTKAAYGSRSRYGSTNGSWSNRGRYDLSSVTYDYNGNIRSLVRKGKTHTGAYGTVDNLTYGYSSTYYRDRLSYVRENGDPYKGFTPGSTANQNISYDSRGNMTAHNGRQISNIAYNIFNLPRTITKSGQTVSVIYSGSGQKLAQISRTGERKDYLGGLELVNGSFSALHHGEGQAQYQLGSWKYVYALTDHLGNTRVVFDVTSSGTARKLEGYAYYPFGMSIEGLSLAGGYDYRYNGKELNEELGLYDYGARWYDPAVARWMSIDPLADSYSPFSPYNYTLNNPIRFIDPDGRSVSGIIVGENGRVLGNDGVDDDKVYVVNTTQSDFDGVSGAGLSKKRAKEIKKFVKANSGNAAAFEGSDIYGDLTEIEGSSDTRQGMMDAVSSDDGSGGEGDANNREYGASVMPDGSVVPGEPGEVGTPTQGATFGNYQSGEKTRIHSHPSGSETTSTASSNDGTGSTTTMGGTTTTNTYRQPPSARDVSNAGTQVRYVAGRRSGTVYIYNNQGVRATIPANRFVTPRQ